MNISYLANTRFPSERAHAAQIAHMCQAFAQNKNRVTLYVNKCGRDERVDVESEFGFVPLFSILDLPPSHLYFTNRLGFFLREIIFIFFYIWNFNKKKTDIIYCRDELILYMLSFVFPRITMVYESHEAKYNFPARKILQKGIKCVCISEGIYHRYLQEGIKKENMLVAHDGIDNSFFSTDSTKKEVCEKLGLPHDKKIAMYIGGFDEWKGIVSFFEAATRIPDVLFVAIGGSESQIMHYQKKYSAVFFLGSLPYRDLKFNQKAADILVVPNTQNNHLSAEYTSPLKLFAHMASNVPMVVSKIPSMRNIVSEDEAYFFEADNPQSLCDTLEYVFTHTQEAKEKAEKAYKKSTQFTWDIRAKNILDFINPNYSVDN